MCADSSSSLAVLRIAVADHLAKLEFLSELSGEHSKIVHELTASLDYSFFGFDVAICLHTKLELSDERMRNLDILEKESIMFGIAKYLVASKLHVRALQEAGAEHIGECVVFFVEGKDGGRCDT